MKRALSLVAAGLLLAILLDWAVANWILWDCYEHLGSLLRQPTRLRGQQARLDLLELSPQPRALAGLELFSRADTTAFRLTADYNQHHIELLADADTRLFAPKTKAHFAATACDFAESRRALAELADALPRISWWKRILIAVSQRPMLLATSTVLRERCWIIGFDGGYAAIAQTDRLPREIRHRHRLLRFFRGPLADPALASAPATSLPSPVKIEAADLDRSLAAVTRILALQLQEVQREPDTVRHEGNGILQIKAGRRLLRLRGSPYEIGLQHGRLLAPNIHRLAERVVYGVGFYYSIEKGQWFLHQAAQLVERQRPHIAPEYFEEMRGVADGAGLPLKLVQAANIFPEFFHCSGLAVFGRATRGDTLLHARVLDYMTEIGLQDEAVTMAVARDGARRFVHVGYAGFIGTVTGMNEQQLAIGEMGGRGEGQWDGTPMAQLLRGALENCDTLEEALDYMRRRPRTCEYYYVISDGKSRTARGVAATPQTFEVIAPGQAVPLLPEAIEDAVLMSAGERYRELVRRVRDRYGRIGPAEMQQIIARGVAMKSNLHNAIFEPPTLSVWIAHASRHRPACDEPYIHYRWEDLFPR